MSRLIKQVLAPIVARVGAATSGALLAAGVPHDTTTAFVAAAGVFLGVAFDVAVVAIAARKQAAR